MARGRGDFYGETLRRAAHAKVDAVWAVVEFINIKMSERRGEDREWGHSLRESVAA